MREVVRIVRSELASVAEAAPRKTWVQRAAQYVEVHAAAVTLFGTLVAATLVLAGAALWYRADPGYWFKQLAAADRKLDREIAKLEYDNTVVAQQIALGNALLDVWKLADAAKAFSDALALDPASIEASHGLRKAEVFQGSMSGEFDPEVVERRLSLIRHDRRWPEDAHALAALGDLEYHRRNWQAAAEMYKAALSQRDTLAHAAFGLGAVAVEQREYGAAADHFRRAAMLSPSNWKYHSNLAAVLLEMDRIETALDAYGVLWRLAPEAILPLLEPARALFRRGMQWHVWIQLADEAARLLADPDVAAKALNQGEWSFHYGERVARLRDLPMKGAYSDGLRAAGAHLLSLTEAPPLPPPSLVALPPDDRREVLDLLADDLVALRERQPQLHRRVEEVLGRIGVSPGR